MLGNLAQFNMEITEFAKRVPEEAAELQRKIVLAAFVKISDRTPVLTGRARGNWIPTIGSPAEYAFDRIDPTGTMSKAELIAMLPSIPPFSVCYISNNVNYIIFLEEGSSQKAPAGMVAVTIEELWEMFK